MKTQLKVAHLSFRAAQVKNITVHFVLLFDTYSVFLVVFTVFQQNLSGWDNFKPIPNKTQSSCLKAAPFHVPYHGGAVKHTPGGSNSTHEQR